MCYSLEDQKRALDFLELELKTLLICCVRLLEIGPWSFA